jgi:transposase
MAAMPTTAATQPDIDALAAQVAALMSQCETAQRENAQLRAQLAWFQRQLFGSKSEKRLPVPDAAQGILGEGFAPSRDTPPGKKRRVAAHERASKSTPGESDETTLFFDESRVPVEVITVANPEIAGLSPDQYDVIGEKVSHRLAQRPGSYVILKYVRHVVKRRDTQALSCPGAPAGVIEGSRADVSFIAGLLIDKFCYHLPLYRQHQRLAQAGVKVSRPWLTQLAQSAIALLEPVFQAQWQSILTSRVKRMDETPIKAGREGPGKMKPAYFWPVMGEADEICFHYHPSRRHEHVQQTLGPTAPAGSVLHTDGYAAYARYVEQAGIAHAQCWAHCRRMFVKAQEIEPTRAAEALAHIGALYAVEEEIRTRQLTGADRRALRQEHAAPAAQRFFAWIDAQFASQGFLPSSPLTKALGYARERREGLMLYLDDPDVEIDTNSLERALRAIPMGRKNWLFCWTELGAKQVGIVQSLLVTCKLHDVDPYDYLVDVLQRVGEHPAARVHELTPKMWKSLFADRSLRSVLAQAQITVN